MKNRKVLIVEDDMFLRSIYTTYLQQQNSEVFEASDGQEALDLIEKELPAVIVLDIMLPKLDGFEVLSQVRSNANKSIATIPVIMLSNLWEEDDVKRAFELGANDYMFKARVTPNEVNN